MQRFMIALVITVVAVSGVAWAMPIGRDHAQSHLIVAVADKCGFNRYPDASGALPPGVPNDQAPEATL